MKAVKRAIILCWIMLIVCFIIKLFGGNWFEIICNNEHFIYVCNLIDKSVITQDIVAFLFYVASTVLVLLATCLTPKPNKKQLITIIVFVVFVWSTQYILRIIKVILEIFMFLVLPFIVRLLDGENVTKKEKLKKTLFCGIIGYILVLVFQILSLLTRNLGLKLIPDNTLIALLLMIDYYIMIILYYLHVRLKYQKKEERKNE